MEAKIIFLFFCLIFDQTILTHNNVIQVYVPDHMVKYIYRVLDSMPGLHYKPGVREYEQNPHQDDFDMNYYDDREKKIKINNDPSSSMPGRYLPTELRYLKYGRLYNRRKNRAAISTHAGYTSDTDTCKIYNHNLVKIWTMLSKFIIHGHQDKPDNMALHNIALLVKAYLDHHDSLIEKVDKETATVPDLTGDIKTNDIKTNVTEVLNQIKEMITDAVNADVTNEIVELIVNKLSTPIQEEEDSQCLINLKRSLVSNVNREFEKYLYDSNCRRASTKDDLALNNNKIREAVMPREHMEMDSRDAKNFLRQWQDGQEESCNTIAQSKFLDRMRLTINEYVYSCSSVQLESSKF